VCLAKIKADKPDIKHMDAFKLAASKWKENPANPKYGEAGKKSAAKSALNPHLNPVSGRRSPVEQRLSRKHLSRRLRSRRKHLLRKDC
jgi:hypothetical protein